MIQKLKILLIILFTLTVAENFAAKNNSFNNRLKMITEEIQIKYIGGPTIYIEIAGIKFITDPTFDPKDTYYDLGKYKLHKEYTSLATLSSIGEIDYVLLSHDHHFDNLDKEGRKVLPKAKKVFTTEIGAERLKGNAIGLRNWQKIEVPTKDERIIQITGTPCRHGPINGDRGPVTGFILNFKDKPNEVVYISGDTVYYNEIDNIIARYNIKLAVLFLGRAVVKEVGNEPLTMTIDESIKFAKKVNCPIVPLHFEGWEHFTETKDLLIKRYQEEGLEKQLRFANAYK
jgi:L-ascorbate metabolism protein UlaG (beta-lactamase superfamily)